MDHSDEDYGLTNISSAKLHEAVCTNDTTLVQWLLHTGVDIHARDGQGRDALQEAARRKGVENIVQLLLESGADVNATPSVHVSALMEAVGSGDTDVLLLLLGHGASVHTRAHGIGSGNALHSTASVGQSEVVKLLLYHVADPDARSGMYGNALQAAAHYGNKESVCVLLDAGADINTS